MGLVELYTGILGEPDTNIHSSKNWRVDNKVMFIPRLFFFRQIYFCRC